jgi:hypothetical protein
MELDPKEYTDNQIGWLKLHQESEIRAVREAVDKVEATNTQKFASQNEWRQTFKDQQSAYVTRREFWGGILAVILALVALYFRK